MFLLLGSVFINFRLGKLIASNKDKRILVVGVCFNLLLLAYYKYAGFFVSNIISLGFDISISSPVLPLAISFFTFQQIAFLVDVYRGKIKIGGAQEYGLFVVFFPQLIAGPIVHYRDLQPQFLKITEGRLLPKYGQGFMYLAIGLLKKLYIADSLADYVNPIFAISDSGLDVDPILALIGWLGYTMQLYFDFSAYGDMALGLGLLLGIQLPINFNSPYKAHSIIDFWHRWHITLGAFLRDYLYIPLGGSRNGELRKYLSLFITMLLGGLWHGAAWTFVFWGALHGLMLTINHGLNLLYARLGIPNNKLISDCGILFTFLGVSLSWMFFRSETFTGAVNILTALPDVINITKESLIMFKINNTLDLYAAFTTLFQALFIAFVCPNSHTIVSYLYKKTKPYHVLFLDLSGKPLSATLCGMVFFIIGKELLAVPSADFLYFNF
ncbi:MBOAT family O-acyltransferase [Thalassotalea piscium]|uniref:Probable alginate O-acetylase n=1 Tax=Thalassotalea piscium TaxID=1230533 RepID=A0A7X0TTF0_9GAMM|nr:MBOAT family O-acyltransferase [Thalassotalea piscium]MBB6543088.1 D-alanyl-lipoteichoic acid acyltransferase DltB (MBOAT superfamily) [Thalassotalea piscium]